MELNLNKPILLTNGKSSENSKTLGQVISNVLAVSSDKQPLKMWGWAIKLEENKPINLDAEDRELFKEWITQHNQLSNLVKAQVLQQIIDQDTPERK